MGTSSVGAIVVTTDELVKASSTDPTAGMLDDKVDGTTITVNGSDKLQREALTGGVTTSGNVATVVTNANLTGGVTSVGNAATVVTNANLTGVVTSTGNATAIADKALSLSKLADGTDGAIVTYDASGVITAVGPGTSGQVLTSAGAGAPPTFTTPSSGSTFNTVYDDTTEDPLYLLWYDASPSGTSSTSWALCDTITIPFSGTFTVTYGQRSPGSSPQYTRMRVNGVAQGSQHFDNSSSYTPVVHNGIVASAGDSVEIWGYTSNAGSPVSLNEWKAFGIFGTEPRLASYIAAYQT